MEQVISQLCKDFPDLTFTPGVALCWSPTTNHISYKVDTNDISHTLMGLLHEVGHASLGHAQYLNDIDLVHKEIQAWEEAQILGEKYGINLDVDHVQDCLDTYREWLYKRSTCPICANKGIQDSLRLYQCLNCGHAWHVTMSRFCRPYRRSATI